jgi:hypothetical protein
MLARPTTIPVQPTMVCGSQSDATGNSLAGGIWMILLALEV